MDEFPEVDSNVKEIRALSTKQNKEVCFFDIPEGVSVFKSNERRNHLDRKQFEGTVLILGLQKV